MEIWKDVVGFEQHYEVSSYGNVRRKGKTKHLAKITDKDGYVVHCFCVNTVRKNVMAHQLVAEAFIGPRPHGTVTRHRDGSKQNNIPSNLEYGSNADNSADMVKHGQQAKGESIHLAKLTEADVINIRKSSLTQDELANLYGVSQGNISQILSRKTWKHI